LGCGKNPITSYILISDFLAKDYLAIIWLLFGSLMKKRQKSQLEARFYSLCQKAFISLLHFLIYLLVVRKTSLKKIYLRDLVAMPSIVKAKLTSEVSP